jgi:hypothetical protein
MFDCNSACFCRKFPQDFGPTLTLAPFVPDLPLCQEAERKLLGEETAVEGEVWGEEDKVLVRLCDGRVRLF